MRLLRQAVAKRLPRLAAVAGSRDRQAAVDRHPFRIRARRYDQAVRPSFASTAIGKPKSTPASGALTLRQVCAPSSL
jgi:hypothetical protein